jgi:hypothetical protein
MAFDGIYRLQEPPLSDPIVGKAQDKAVRGFGSYAIPLGVKVNNLYDKPTADFIAEYQRRKEESGYRPVLPANPSAKRGDMDFETKKALGILPTPPGPISQKYVGYAVPGTWGIWNVGPQCMAVNRSPERVFLQGVGYNTSAFLNPDPQHSYIEAVNEGVAELLRLSLPDHRPKFVAGYSMGAEVTARFLASWPADRRQEIIQVFHLRIAVATARCHQIQRCAAGRRNQRLLHTGLGTRSRMVLRHRRRHVLRGRRTTTVVLPASSTRGSIPGIRDVSVRLDDRHSDRRIRCDEPVRQCQRPTVTNRRRTARARR